jgi:succinate dehydrogenase / fumarate reductase cytochrome b subunit
MNALATLVRSTVGQKVLMAVTGLMMVGWLVLHTTGNLLVFKGEKDFDKYAAFIQSGFGVEPALLWLLRFVMLAAIVVHIRAALVLSARNRASRPASYAAGRKDQATSYTAHFMRGGGIVILLYLVFHILHLTTGNAHFNGFEHGKAFRNLVNGLSQPAVAAAYIVANAALGAHLFHGVSSAFQTLGVDHPGYNGLKFALGKAVPAYIAGGNLLIAVSILAGLVHL